MKNKLFLVVLAMMMVFGLAVSAQASASFDFNIFQGDGSVLVASIILLPALISRFMHFQPWVLNDGVYPGEGLLLEFPSNSRSGRRVYRNYI